MSRPRSPTRYRFSSVTGRCSSMTAAVGPRTVSIHVATSSAFDTVADRHTRPTEASRCTITSSHTGPR